MRLFFLIAFIFVYCKWVWPCDLFEDDMPTEHKVFQSSMLEKGSYNSDTQTLEVTFASGVSWVAQDVPPSVWAGLKQASSPGRYYHREVKPYYSFTEA